MPVQANKPDPMLAWSGTLPASWRTKRLKFAVDRITWKETYVRPYIGLENVESWSGKLTSKSAEVDAESQGIGFQDGDVLFGKLRPYLAKVWLANTAGTCSSEFLVLRATYCPSIYVIC
jgi:type I restriction enzyme S subunit